MLNLISKIPKIRFDNYLDQLLDDSNPSSSTIRVRGIEKFLEKCIKETGKRDITNELEISEACLRGWVNGRRGMPLSYLKKLIKLCFEPNFHRSKWDKIFTMIKFYTLGGSPHRVTLPLFATPRLFYFVGYLFGDGCLSDAQKRSYENGGFLYEIKIADFSLTHTEGISKLFNHLFNVSAKVRKERIKKGERCYYIDPKCKIIHRFLNRVFMMPVGEKKNRLKIPSTVFRAPPQLRRWFIAGFFDADGSIYRIQKSDRQKNTIKFKQTSLEILKDIQYLLNQDMGIKLNGPYEEKGGVWSISSGKRSTVEKFCKNVPLTHNNKRQQAKKIIS